MSPATQSDSQSMPRVAVIILNWNGSAMLRRFLPDVIANTDPAIGQVIVADNGSDDDSLEVLASEFPQVEVMRLDRNYGFAEGYNRAIARVSAPYTLLLNSDVAPAPGWLAPLVEYMDANPGVGACQPKIRSVSDPALFEYAGASGGYLDRNGYPYCRGRIFDSIEEDRGQYDTISDIDWATGAALMIRTELYRQAGGLPSSFFAHMEEIDLCWRLQAMGWRIAVVPQSVVMHLGGGSLPATSPHKTYLNFRNNLLLLHRNLPDSCRRRILFRRRLLDTLAWGRYVAGLKWKHAAAILRAHRDFRRMRASSLTDAVITQCMAVDRVNVLEGRPDILVSYYLRGRRKFSDL